MSRTKTRSGAREAFYTVLVFVLSFCFYAACYAAKK